MAGPTLFASLFCYAAQKNCQATGVDWREWLATARAHPDACVWTGFRTLREVESLGEEVLSLVSSGTLITKARSQAAGAFLASTAEVWVTIDDDVYADREVVKRLVYAARDTRAVVSAPCALRSGEHLNFGLEVSAQLPLGDVVRATRTGLGLVAMHRTAIEFLAKDARWIHEPGKHYPALFLETVEGTQWIGEDYAFSDLCRRAGVSLFALTEAPTTHAGRRAKLGRDLCVYVGDEDTAARMNQGG